MSDTKRKLPRKMFRRPRGHKRALILGERSVPPSSWDDIQVGREAYMPWMAAEHMDAQGVDPKTITAKLRASWTDLTQTQAERIVRRFLRPDRD